MEKQTAGRILSKLESTASDLEKLAKSGRVDPNLANKIVYDIDSFSDKFEAAIFGKKSLQIRKAKLIMREPDEPYMDTFSNPNKFIYGDEDEPYMHESGASFNGKSIPTYDQDNTSNMTDRDEYDVRGLSEWSDGTKRQPSWEGNPAGKSTRQGSHKTWA